MRISQIKKGQEITYLKKWRKGFLWEKCALSTEVSFMIDDCLVDSNILIYAFDKDDKRKNQKAAKLLQEVMLSEKGFLSAQNLAEFHINATSKISRPISKEDSQEIIAELSLNFHILKYNEKTIFNAINMENLYKVHFWDALIAATMQENNLKTIYTENTNDFKKIPWVAAINPLNK